MLKISYLTLLIFIGWILPPFPERSCDELKAIKVFSKTEVVTLETGEVLSFIDTVSVYHYSDYLMYLIPFEHQHFYVPEAFLDDPEIEPDSIISSRQYSYYFFKPGEKTGYRWVPLYDSTFFTCDFDSFLARQSSLKFDFQVPDSAYSTTGLLKYNQSESREVYYLQNALEVSCSDCVDSINVFYNKINKKIGFFSFGQTLDSARDSKITKLQFIFNPIPKGLPDFDIPRREFVFGFFEFTPENTGEVVALFDRVIKEKFHAKP